MLVSSVLATCGRSTVTGGCWLVLPLASVGGGVLGAASGWSGSCVSEPDVLVGGVGFGDGAGVLSPCGRSVGIGLWTPVLIPSLSGDLLRDGGVCGDLLRDGSGGCGGGVGEGSSSCVWVAAGSSVAGLCGAGACSINSRFTARIATKPE